MTATDVYALSNDDRGTKASIPVNVSVTIAGSSAQAVSCAEGSTIAITAAGSSTTPNVDYVYSFGWRYSGESSWRILQNQQAGSSIPFAVPEKPAEGGYVEIYVGAVGTSSQGSGVARVYRDLYITPASDVSAIYDALTSDPSYPDVSDSSAVSMVEEVLDIIQQGLESWASADPSYPDATGLFAIGAACFPPQILAFLPVVCLLGFIVWLLRR